MKESAEEVDVIVVGAGVVGLAVAAALARKGRDVVVLEQHALIGSETSSRNSEVIHAGIYYPANSLKARLCVRGKELLYDYCTTHQIPHRQCGKIIVAANGKQAATVREYIQRGHANGVDDLRWLEVDEINHLEPNVACVGGVLSPSTGIIDSHAYMLSLLGSLEQHGGMLALQTPVQRLARTADRVIVETGVGTGAMRLSATWVVNACGLTAPQLAAGLVDVPRAHYAIGHYYSYSGRQPFSRLVYPVAEEGGLGVHVTLDLAGQVKFGPDVRWVDHIDYAFDDSRRGEFLHAIRQYYPDVDSDCLHADYTGIRPKLAGPGGGFQDFRIDGPSQHGMPGLVNLLGIESPGLTASLAIAEEVTALVCQ